MSFEVDMREVDELAKQLADTAQAVDAVHGVAKDEGSGLKARAVAGAPRDRPWLANAIRLQTRKFVGGSVATVRAEGSDPRGRAVAFYVEFGTSRMAPRPFMANAVEPALISFPEAVLAAVDPFKASGAAAISSGDE